MNKYPVFYHNAPQYFISAMLKPPFFWNEKDGEKISVHVKNINLDCNLNAKVVTSLYNSSVFYWWFILHSNCRDLSKREIETIPLSLDKINQTYKEELSKHCDVLMNSYEENKYRKETQYKMTGKVIYDEYYPKYSKHIIDQIDIVLSRHYGFTEEELDFIINYDIKYRMGKELYTYIEGTL